jgi:hypothetical protein
LKDFFEINENKGLELLYDDKKWIREISKGVLNTILVDLLEKYSQLWQSTMDNEPLDYKKQNVGRFAANTFLREAIENLHKYRS